MTKLLIKLVLVLLMLAFSVTASLIAYLLFVFDLNQLKPDIEQLGRDKGIPLHINGSLQWQWWPQLAISIEDVAIGEGNERLAAVGELTAEVAIRPLLQREIIVEQVSADRVSLNLVVGANGEANWEALLNSPAGEHPNDSPSEAQSDSGGELSFAMQAQQMAMTNADIHYWDQATNQRYSANGLSVIVNNANLQGQPIDLDFQSQLTLGEPNLTLSTSGQMRLVVDQPMDNVTISSLQLKLMSKAPSRPQLAIVGQGSVALSPLQVSMDAHLESFSPRAWMQALSINSSALISEAALTQATAALRLAVSQESWQLAPLTLQLDQTQLVVNAASDATGKITATVTGDQLNLDQYLASPGDTAEELEAAQSEGYVAPRLSEEPLDFSLIKDISSDIDAEFKQITYRGLTFADLQLHTQVNSGRAEIKRLAVKAAGGEIQVSGLLDARTKSPTITSKGQLNNVEIQPLLAVFAQEERMVGVINGNWHLVSRGDSLAQWQAFLRGNALVEARSLTIDQLDVERGACQLAALVNREPAPELNWKGETRLNDVTFKLSPEGGRLHINTIEAGVENLSIQGSGRFDYLEGNFRLPLKVLFIGSADQARKCQVRDRWRNRPLPLRCKGHIDELGADTCLPDTSSLDDLLREEIKQKADEQVDKLKQKADKKVDEVEDRLKRKLEEELGEEGRQAVDELLRGLFK